MLPWGKYVLLCPKVLVDCVKFLSIGQTVQHDFIICPQSAAVTHSRTLPLYVCTCVFVSRGLFSEKSKHVRRIKFSSLTVSINNK